MESLILRWHSKMIQEVTSFAIPVSRAAHERHHPYKAAGRAERYLFRVRGLFGFPLIPHYPATKSPDIPCTDWQDYVILNSTANTDKALYPLADYGHIHCMLDNDEAGRKAVEAIRQEYKWRVRDASHLYSGHNDLNDYLRSLKVKQSQDLTVTDKPQPEQDNRQNPGEKRKRGLRM